MAIQRDIYSESRSRAVVRRSENSHIILKSGRRSQPMVYFERIVRDSEICGGEPVFKGTRVTLRTVLASLAAGDSPEEIIADFPTLQREDIQAAIVFAAASAEEDLPAPALPDIR